MLMNRVVSGKLEPSSRLNESELSEQIGVSRTPLREALIELERAGMVEFRQGKGFSVRPLDHDRAEELFEMIGWLESAALQLAGRPDEGQLHDLHSLNQIRLEETTPEKLVELDVEWHELLLRACENTELQKVLAEVRRRIDRYQYAFMLKRDQVRTAVEQHEEILRALHDGDVKGAARILRNHWSVGFARVAEAFGAA